MRCELEDTLQCRPHGRHFLSLVALHFACYFRFTSLLSITESETANPDAFGGQQSKSWVQQAGPPGRQLTHGEQQPAT